MHGLVSGRTVSYLDSPSADTTDYDIDAALERLRGRVEQHRAQVSADGRDCWCLWCTEPAPTVDSGMDIAEAEAAAEEKEISWQTEPEPNS